MASTDARDANGGTRGTTGPATKRTSGPTRERLLVAARESFAKLGFASTRVADIVALAGTSHGTFYTYFDGKRDALLALTEQAAGAIYGAAVAPLAGATRQSPRDAIRARLTFSFAPTASGGTLLGPGITQARSIPRSTSCARVSGNRSSSSSAAHSYATASSDTSMENSSWKSRRSR